MGAMARTHTAGQLNGATHVHLGQVHRTILARRITLITRILLIGGFLLGHLPNRSLRSLVRLILVGLIVFICLVEEPWRGGSRATDDFKSFALLLRLAHEKTPEEASGRGNRSGGVSRACLELARTGMRQGWASHAIVKVYFTNRIVLAGLSRVIEVQLVFRRGKIGGNRSIPSRGGWSRAFKDIVVRIADVAAL